MSTRIERAERRLRAAEALTADLRLAVEQERRLAIYHNTGSAQAQQEAANDEPTPQIRSAAPREITARAAATPRPGATRSADRPAPTLSAPRTAWSRAEAELTRYARALHRAGASPLEAELSPLIHRASAAGLDFESIAAFAEGRTPRLSGAAVVQLDRGRPVRGA
jgi:hypothetical protein